MLNGFMNEYPYTDFHEMNLSWCIRKIIELSKNMVEFIKLNEIKYADPLDWSITSQYEKNTVVFDDNTGIAYLSVAPVPAGVGIDNTDYWTPIFDLSPLIADIDQAMDDIKMSITANDEEDNIIASKNYIIGELLWHESKLYVVCKDISQGNGFVFTGDNKNLIQTTVEAQNEMIYYSNDKKLSIHGKIDDYSQIVTSGDYHVYTPQRKAIEILKVE